MRTYHSVTDLKNLEVIEKLYTKNEMAIFSKRNTPQYIGCLYDTWIGILNDLNYSIRETNSTQIQRRKVLTCEREDWDNHIAYILLVNGSPRYIFFPYEIYINDKIYEMVKDITRKTKEV